MRALFFLLALALSSATFEGLQTQLKLEAASTCAGYSCCAGYVLRSDAANTGCVNGCTVAQCCVPTCAAPTFTCNAGTSLISNPASVICSTAAASISSSLGFTGYICLQSKCCGGGSSTNTCAGYTCCPGYVLRTDAATANCEGACSVAQCCVPTCAAPTWTGCVPPAQLKSNPGSIVCDARAASISTSLGFTGYICTQSKCCGTTTTTCASFGSCPAGQTKKSDSTVCATTPCSTSDCCLAPTTTCFQAGNPVQECTNGRVRAASFSCTDSSCNQDICCDETCGSADLPLLCANRPINLANSGHRCASQVGSGNLCLPDECCLTTCASDTNLRCPVGTTLRPSPDGHICTGSTCTTQECCVESRPQCPANFACNRNPGDVNKALPQYCATSPCAYEECCCSACNYCGKHFAGSCPIGTKLQMDVDCGKDSVCNADLCCIGSCFNYPCPDGPSDPALINAQCANPKQCTQQECCQRWGD